MSFLKQSDFTESANMPTHEDLWRLLGYSRKQQMALRKVHAGIAFLDERHGVGNWEERIQDAIAENTFDVGLTEHCALALVEGDMYEKAVEAIGFSDEEARRHGFLASKRVDYDHLTWAWEHEMRSMGYC